VQAGVAGTKEERDMYPSSVQVMQMIANERAADWHRNASSARLARTVTLASRRRARAARIARGSASSDARCSN
jgi:hypothetical protein